MKLIKACSCLDGATRNKDDLTFPRKEMWITLLQALSQWDRSKSQQFPLVWEQEFSGFLSFGPVLEWPPMKRKLLVKERRDGGCHCEQLLKIWGPVKFSRRCCVLQHSAWGKTFGVVLWSWAEFDLNGAEAATLIWETILGMNILDVRNLRIQVLTLKYYPVRTHFSHYNSNPKLF